MAPQHGGGRRKGVDNKVSVQKETMKELKMMRGEKRGKVWE